MRALDNGRRRVAQASPGSFLRLHVFGFLHVRIEVRTVAERTAARHYNRLPPEPNNRSGAPYFWFFWSRVGRLRGVCWESLAEPLAEEVETDHRDDEDTADDGDAGGAHLKPRGLYVSRVVADNASAHV